MRIAICDDDPKQIQLTSQYVRNWSRDREVTVEICEFNNAESFLFQWSTTISFDMAFLDIQMGSMSGMELAEKIRKIDDQLIIVFITGLKEHILHGYEVRALHYLLKPIKSIDCYKCLEQAYEIITKHRTDTFLIPVEGQIRRFNYNELYYFEVFSHYVSVQTRKGIFSYKKKISDLAEELPKEIFVRCHRSYIINLQYVKTIEKKLVTMDNGNSVPISSDRWRVVNHAFLRYHMK